MLNRLRFKLLLSAGLFFNRLSVYFLFKAADLWDASLRVLYAPALLPVLTIKEQEATTGDGSTEHSEKEKNKLYS